MISGIGSNSYSSYVQAPKQDYFQYLDQDQNSSVDSDELSVMADKISELSGEEVSTSDLMSQIDQDGDSQLTGEELKVHMDSILGERGTPESNPGMMMEGAMRKQMMMGPQGGGKPPGGKPPGGKPPGGMEESEGITAMTDTSESTSLLDYLLEAVEETDSTDLTEYLNESEEDDTDSALTSIYQAMVQESMMKFNNISTLSV